jgi:CubicO group peptidase (beta-lactamase class C family)
MKNTKSLAAVILLAVSCWAQQPPTTASQEYELRAKTNVVTWDDGGAISHYVYLHTSEVFPTALIKRGGPVRELKVGLRPEIGDFIVEDAANRKVSLRDYVANSALDGFLIVHKGRIVYEQYPHMQAGDLHLAFSITKAFIGTVIGILEDRKQLDMSKPVEYYLSDFHDTAWAGISIRNVADMASGMEVTDLTPEAFTDPKNKFFQMEAALGWEPRTEGMPDTVMKGDTYNYLRSLKQLHPAGTVQEYTSANTALLAFIAERITGKRLAEVIRDEIWSKIGAEADAQIIVNERGVPIAHGGMVMTLRDLARFGIVLAEAANRSPNQPAIFQHFVSRLLVPGRSELLPAKHPEWLSHSSYQWDMVSKAGQIAKGGFADQMLFIDCRRNVVIVYFGTNPTVDAMPVPLALRKLAETFF